MATLTRSISTFSNGQLSVETPGFVLPQIRLMRVLHEKELASYLPHTTPPDRPEVRALFPNHFSPFTYAHQHLSKEMNPLLKPGNLTAVYHFKLWITNNNGFGMTYDPRRNYFENLNLTSPLPKVEALTCGGNLLHVVDEDDSYYFIETLDWHDLPPTVEWMDEHPWLVTYAVNMGSDGTPRRFSQGTQPNGFVPGVRHPLICNPSEYKIKIPKWRLTPWNETFPPDPYKIYLT